jgi:acetyltransferase-like isoleucine patch superfamily enzyme
VVVNFGVSAAGGVAVGDQVWIGPGCVIGHDTVIEPFALLAPAAVVSGLCEIGKASYVGAGAMIRQKIRIGPGALVGMGAVVVKDVPPRTVVVGNPAGPIGSTSLRIRTPPAAESFPVAAPVCDVSLYDNLSTS